MVIQNVIEWLYYQLYLRIDFDRIKMMKEYFLRLRDLQQDRVQFQSQKQRTAYGARLDKQEDKYQAYIIEQMNDKNKIIAASAITTVLTQACKSQLSPLYQICRFAQTVRDGDSLRSYIGDSVRDDSVSIEFILVKLSVEVMVRLGQKAIVQQKKRTFDELYRFSKNQKVIERLVRGVGIIAVRRGFQALRGSGKQGRGVSEGRIFDDSFSMIVRQDLARRQKCAVDESYLSFILEKENVNSECNLCRESCQAGLQREKELMRTREELGKVREQLSYLKNLLTEKTLQLKEREEECQRLRGRTGEESDRSGITSSRNSSICSEMERYVLGGKRIRKNGSRASEGQQISKELLGKYMRESFQLKESIDVARQLCLELQQSLPVAGKVVMRQVLKVLNFGEQVSMVDDY